MPRLLQPAIAILLLTLLPPAAMAGKYNRKLDIGDAAPVWKDLPGTDGQSHSLADLKKKQAVVVVFTCNTCPYSVDYEDRLIEFAKRYAGEEGKVGLVAINVNRVDGDRLPDMKKRAKAKGFNFPYLYDESQQIARDYGAVRTPEFFVLDAKRKVVYMGAMDDNSFAADVKQPYVREAVAAVLNGETPKVQETPPVGCTVRYERVRRKRD